MIKKLLGFTEKMFRKKVTNINQNVLNYLGSTGHHHESKPGHQPVVELLLDRGANIDQKDNNGGFILFIHLCINLIIN